MADKSLRILMIGAHPDDCDIRSGGYATKMARLGHRVKYVSLSDGSRGHYDMSREAIAERRRQETQRVCEIAGIEYEVGDIPDGEIMADLDTRKRVIALIRDFSPDLLFSLRPIDYHPDHRNAALLVQDASYLLIVPNLLPEFPAMRRMPVIMHFYDRFQQPPFRPDVLVDIDDVIEDKFRMLDCHRSQFYEWLPYSREELHLVPSTSDEARFEWLHQPRLHADGTADADELLSIDKLNGKSGEQKEAIIAYKYRDLLRERYGARGEHIKFAEAFAVSEYGAPLTPELRELYFPF